MPCLRTWKNQGLSRLLHPLVFRTAGDKRNTSQHTETYDLDCSSMLVIVPGNEVEEEHAFTLKCRQAVHQDCVTGQCCTSCFLMKSGTQLRSNHVGQSASNTGRKRIMASHRRYQAIRLGEHSSPISSKFTL